MLIESPWFIWFLKNLQKAFPTPKRYRIVEDEDEIGYWFEEIKDENE